MVVLDNVTAERARRAVSALARTARVRAAFVFGSHAFGRADQWSDLDIAAFIDGVETWTLRQRVQAVVDAQKEAGDDIEFHLFPAKFIEHPPTASLGALVLREGIPVEVPAEP